MKKQFRLVFAAFAILSNTVANAGLFDSIKTIGAGVSALAESAADSVVAASTNTLNSVKEQASQIIDQTNGVITIQSRQTVVVKPDKTVDPGAGSQSDVQERLQPRDEIGKQRYSTERRQNRYAAGNVQDGQQSQQRFDASQQRYRDSDILQRKSAGVKSRRVKGSRGNAVEYADDKTGDAYGEVWKSFEKKTALITELKKRICDDVDYQLKQSYAISPKDKYEVIRVKSQVVQFSGINSGLKSRLMMEGCLCPRSSGDFNAWTNAMFSVIDADIRKLETTIARRTKFYEFLNQWAKLQDDYVQLLSLFDIEDVEFLAADMDGDVDLVGEVEECRIRREFYPVLAKHFNTGNFKLVFKCPRTDAALELWIGKVSKHYESKTAEYRAKIDEVKKELCTFKSFAAVLRGKTGALADIGALALADPVKYDELNGRIKRLVDKGKLMPLEIKPYLSNEQLKGELVALVKLMDEISASASVAMKEFEEQGKASDALYAEWHKDIVLTNVPGVAGVGLGSSLYVASKKLVSNVANIRVFTDQEASYKGQRSYLFNSISKFPALENIYYEFGGDLKTQGLCFVKGSYSFKDEMPYKDVVASYHKRMPHSPSEIAEKKIIGHDIDELRSRNRWAAWQVDYYTRRAESSTQGMQKKQIAAKDDIIRRYKARPLIVCVTTLKAAGYEVQIISDVNEVNAKCVLMKDDIALSKLKQSADSQ